MSQKLDYLFISCYLIKSRKTDKQKIVIENFLYYKEYRIMMYV